MRTTIISPGATESELHSHSSDPETNHEVRSFYQIYQITPDSVARAIAFAIDQPADVDINEIVLRPTAQDFSQYPSAHLLTGFAGAVTSLRNRRLMQRLEHPPLCQQHNTDG